MKRKGVRVMNKHRWRNDTWRERRGSFKEKSYSIGCPLGLCALSACFPVLETPQNQLDLETKDIPTWYRVYPKAGLPLAKWYVWGQRVKRGSPASLFKRNKEGKHRKGKGKKDENQAISVLVNTTMLLLVSLYSSMVAKNRLSGYLHIILNSRNHAS